jgi:manganese/zinc/iron transport system permease protein
MIGDPNVWWIVSGCCLLGLACGTLGVHAHVRKQSLLGDVLAHASFPGVCVAFLFTEKKAFLPFAIGAICFCVIALAAMYVLTRILMVKEDAALAVTLSAFFGIGIVLLTRIQAMGIGAQAGLDHFLFGQAAALVAEDGIVLAVLAVLVLVVVCGLHHPLQAIAFDAQWARVRGIPIAVLDAVLLLLYVLCIVAGIQAVGVLMMAAMLITPAVTARAWCTRLPHMIVLAGAVGATAGGSGAWLSTIDGAWPIGPLVVLVASTACAASLLIGPYVTKKGGGTI